MVDRDIRRSQRREAVDRVVLREDGQHLLHGHAVESRGSVDPWVACIVADGINPRQAGDRFRILCGPGVHLQSSVTAADHAGLV